MTLLKKEIKKRQLREMGIRIYHTVFPLLFHFLSDSAG